LACLSRLQKRCVVAHRRPPRHTVIG
jgi:hypothetical protein